MPEYKDYNFIKRWPENSPIDRWNYDRIQLNIIIDAFNEWQISGGDKHILLSKIEFGIQILGEESDAYYRELIKMKNYVKD